MRTSEKIDLISAALLKAQANLDIAKKDKNNSHFKSTYADYGAIVKASRPALLSNDIVVIQGARLIDVNTWQLTTRLQHISGQWMESDYPLVAKDANNPQAFGSATTYAKRFSLAAMVGVVAEDEDDDGDLAASNTPSDAVPNNLGDYIPSFGKYYGKQLKSVPIEELVQYAQWLENTAVKEKKPLGGRQEEFVGVVMEYSKAYND